jgi:hypothetical protein
MSIHRSSRILVAMISIAIYLGRPAIGGEDELSTLLDRLRTGRLEQVNLYALESQPADPRTIPALRDAFDRFESKSDKQNIAVTLIHLGDKSPLYFDLLTRYAGEAVDDRAPSFLKYDIHGKSVKDGFDTGFENWCALNGKDPKAMAELQTKHAVDVLMLARAQDRRSTDLFLRGLSSPNEFVVMYSVQGLGRLQVATALPLIRRTAERLPGEAAAGIGMQLPWFTSPEAYELMLHLVPDGRMREFFRNAVAMERQAEIAATRNREGARSQK